MKRFIKFLELTDSNWIDKKKIHRSKHARRTSDFKLRNKELALHILKRFK